MPRTLAYFKDRKRPSSDWIIPGWLKRKNTAFIMGRPKRACKSWLLLNLAWQLSEGKPLWGVRHSKEGYIFTPPRPMRVVYFTQEDTEDDIHDRVALLLGAGWQPNPNVYIVPKNLKLTLDPTGMPPLCAEIDAARAEGPIDVVLFDPMRRMHRGSENDSEAIAGLWQVLDAIHERYNCATVFSHHIVKPPRDAGSKWDETSPFAGRGSGDIYGGGDAFINVVEQVTHGRTRGKRLLDLHFQTKRGPELTPVTVAVNFKTGEIEFVEFTGGRPKKHDTSTEVPDVLGIK